MDTGAKTNQPRAYTADECREKLLEHLGELAEYYAAQTTKSSIKKVCGVVFSFLALLDGESAGLPGFRLVPAPHKSDKEYRRERGENWWPADVNLADGSLHDRWANRNK